MIRSFGDKATEDVFNGLDTKRARGFGAVVKVAARKLDMLNAAHRLDDLRSPPANRLEARKGDLKGLHSVRVNDQFRIVFRWDEGAHDVRITDHH